mmetsp:Transcript_25824/g.29535  ORF Transcript_25824/g.29535 Transcript_25824/m.29535 type:complete len:223 (-) Transcript_25824:179-847(-)
MSDFAVAPPAQEEDNVVSDFYEKQVELVNLKAESLNGRTGTVLPKPTSNGRVQVQLDDAQGSAPKIVSVRLLNVKLLKLGDNVSSAPAPALTNSATTTKRARPASMTGRPGTYKVGWDWREVLPDQNIPPGLEIMASFEDGVPTIARIPRKWWCDIFLSDNDSEHARIEVERTTTVEEVIEGFQQKISAIVAGTILVDGKECKDNTATIEKAGFFGKKISIR